MAPSKSTFVTKGRISQERASALSTRLSQPLAGTDLAACLACPPLCVKVCRVAEIVPVLALPGSWPWVDVLSPR